VLSALGLDYPTLRLVNARLLMTSLSNFGQTGPYRDWRAQDLTLYGMGGEMYTSGAAGRAPLKQAHNLTLYQGGAVAATATMVGLRGVRRHGVGQHIDVSLFETQAGSIDRRLTSLVAYQYTGDNPGTGDARPVGILPAGIFPCKDGYVDIRCTMNWWPRLVAMLGMPELHDDPRFGTEEARLNPAHREPFLQILHAWLQRHTRQEIVYKAQQARLPGTAVNTPAQALDDPHFIARDAFVAVTHPLAGTWKLPGAPFRPSLTPWQIRRPAPLLGQDTERVFHELLQLTDADLHELRQTGVIA
jgi:crotonobetainyl-CoA:carnitine CoA-transferase CaiB-like acyl-CoA transferase